MNVIYELKLSKYNVLSHKTYIVYLACNSTLLINSHQHIVMLENMHSGMTDFKNKCFKHKSKKSKTHVAKYNKLIHRSIPFVAQVNLKKILNQLVFSAILKPPTNMSVDIPLLQGLPSNSQKKKFSLDLVVQWRLQDL